MRIVVHTSLNFCEGYITIQSIYKIVLICHNCLINICGDDDDKEEKEEEERKYLNLIGL